MSLGLGLKNKKYVFGLEVLKHLIYYSLLVMQYGVADMSEYSFTKSESRCNFSEGAVIGGDCVYRGVAAWSCE